MNLYNTERPVRFDDMIGQEATIRALKLGLKRGMFEHASIFYGQTGGGKTTAARIVASYLNCENPREDGEPCCECAACRALREDNYMDYYELNAAKDGGKSDISNLISEVSYMPAQGKVKVIVIDEAHCLTSDAWKSLLKVLEEPPEHVYFILCTTAFNAIPPEIANRCGKYCFTSISSDTLYQYLCDMRLRLGHVNYSDEALQLIANSSKGSARDAVNTYSHVRMPFADGEMITAEEVKTYLSLVGPEKIAEFIISCSLGAIKDAVNVLAAEEKSAVEATTFLKSTCNMVSDAITVVSGGKLTNGCSDEYLSYINDIMHYVNIDRLISVAAMLNESYSNTAERTYSALRLAVGRVCIAVNKVDGSKGVEIAGNVLNPVQNSVINNELIKRLEALEKLVGSKGSCNYEAGGNSNSETNGVQVEEKTSISDEKEQSGCETVNPLFALFGNSSTEEVVNDVEQGAEISEEEIYYANMAGSYEDMEDIEYEQNPFENDEQQDKEVQEQNSMQPDVSDNTEVVNDCQIDNGIGGIKFSNPFLAEAFKSANTQGSKAEQALREACMINSILNTLVMSNCKKEITDTQVVLATPFQPVKDALDALLAYEKVANVIAVTCDGLLLE